MKIFFVILLTIFLMELADKTQLAAIGFATKYNPITVYAGAVLGMAICTVISVALGKIAATFVPTKYLKILVGIIFIAVGIWSIVKG